MKRYLLVMTALTMPFLLTATDRVAAFAPMQEQHTGTQLTADRVLIIYGTKEKLAKIKCYRMEGTLLNPSGQQPSPFDRTFCRSSSLAVNINYDFGVERRLLENQRGWRGEGGSIPMPVSGPLLDSMVLQAARADLPWILHERPSSWHTIPDPKGDTSRLTLQLSLSQNMELRIVVDPKTWHIVASRGILRTPEGDTDFVTEYSDFRTVDGIVFPFHEENYASGQKTGTTVINKVIIDPPLKGNEFVPH